MPHDWPSAAPALALFCFGRNSSAPPRVRQIRLLSSIFPHPCLPTNDLSPFASYPYSSTSPDAFGMVEFDTMNNALSEAPIVPRYPALPASTGPFVYAIHTKASAI